MNVVTRIEALTAAGGWAHRPAYHGRGRTVTHSQLHHLSARAAVVLAARGVGRGDRVLLALPDDIGLVAAFLAIARLGAVAVLVNPAATAADHAYAAGDSATVLSVYDAAAEGPGQSNTAAEGPGQSNTAAAGPGQSNTAAAGPGQSNTAAAGPGQSSAALPGRFADGLDVAELVGGELSPSELTGGGPPVADCADSDPLYVQYTSGTTGKPKGVVHRHGDLEQVCAASGTAVLGLTADDVLLSVSKMYFTYGFDNSLVFPLFSGASAVLIPDKFAAAAAAAAVRDHRATLLFTVPSASVKLLSASRRADFASVRAIVSAGETLSGSLHRRLSDFTGAPVLDQIGSTEVGQAFCSNTVYRDVPGSVGTAVPGIRLQIRDGAGEPVPDGSVGELWVTGPTLTAGYLNKPEATAAAFRDGWFNTRDLVRHNQDGTYTCLGRGDDMEIVGGINVSPHEIEDTLHEHDAVREVAVVAVRDDLGASRLTAFVVPAPGADPASLPAQLASLARDRLAAFKVPKSVHVVTELPRTPSGKLRRFVLRGES